MQLSKNLAFVSALSALTLAGSAQAALVVVDASGNSSTGGVGQSSGLVLTTGQMFHSSVATTDLWNAGALPRWSNADGLIATLFATGTDDSGQAAGTQIGALFPMWTQGGLTAPFNSLVGSIGGVFKVLGTNFNGPAWGNGALTLYFWDQNSGDNTQFITVDIGLDGSGGVPEPATWAMMIAGFGLVGATLRRRKAVAVTA